MKNFILIILLFYFTSAQAESLTLALNWKAEPEFGGFYAAVLQGYYKKQGLDVKILEGGSGTPTVQMLANNKVDFAIVSADEIILSHEQNKDYRVKALFAVYQTSPYIIMAHAEKNFKNLKEVFSSDGLLAMQSGLPYYQFLVQKFGKPRAKVVPYLGGITHFLNDKNYSQQGFLTSEPLVAEKSGAKVKSFLLAEEGFNPYLVVLATHKETLQKKPDLVKKMILASRQGWISYLKNPQATNIHMSQLNKAMDLETFDKIAQIQKNLIQTDKRPLGSMELERWETLIKQLTDLKLIKSQPQAHEFFFFE